MSEEEVVLPDNVVPVLKSDGSVGLKTLRGSRSRDMVLTEAAVQQRFKAQKQRQSYCFSVQISGKAGSSVPLCMTPFEGIVTQVQVRRNSEMEDPLLLVFEAAMGSVESGFAFKVPKGANGARFMKKGAQLPQIKMPEMTPIVVTPDADEIFWINIIFKEGRAQDAGASTDSGEDLSAGTEG